MLYKGRNLKSQLKTIVADHFCKCLAVVMQLTIDRTTRKKNTQEIRCYFLVCYVTLNGSKDIYLKLFKKLLVLVVFSFSNHLCHES